MKKGDKVPIVYHDGEKEVRSQLVVSEVCSTPVFPGLMSDDDIKRYYEDAQRRNGKLALEIMESYVDGQHSWGVVLVTDHVLGTAIEISAKEIVKVSHQEIVVDGIPWVLPEIDGMSFADVYMNPDD